MTGSRTLEANGTIAGIASSLQDANIAVEHVASQTREPEVADMDAATAGDTLRRLRDGDFLLAVGGGSAIDLAKAVAAMAMNQAQGTACRIIWKGSARG